MSEGRRWTETALANPAEAPAVLRAALLASAGDFAMMQGDFSSAVALLDESIALARETADRETLTYALGWRGITALHMRDYVLSRQLLEEAVLLARDAPVPLWEAFGLMILASVTYQLGDDDGAAGLVEEAHAVSQSRQNVWVTAHTRNLMGSLAVKRRDLERADALYLENLMLTRAIGEHRFLPGALAGVARVLAARGSPEGAARICGAVEAMLDVAGINLSPTGQGDYDHAIAIARAELNEAVFIAARDAGRATRLDEILAEVNREPFVGGESSERDHAGLPRARRGLTQRRARGTRFGGPGAHQSGDRPGPLH